MHLIKNFNSLAKGKSRKMVLEALEHMMREVSPRNLMESSFKIIGSELELKTVRGTRKLRLERFKRIILLGAGKAVMEMASALPFQFSEGVLIIPRGTSKKQIKNVQIYEGSHPKATPENVKAVQKFLDIALNTEDTDLVVCLFSGGGSALLSFPSCDIELEEMENLTSELMNKGADIRETNAVRKHISRVKGGRLAQEIHPATILTFLLSDVVGDQLDTIASGPTVPDNSTYKEALDILHYYKIAGRYPKVVAHLEKGIKGELEETPKENDVCFENSFTCLIGDNTRAIESVSRYLGEKKKKIMEYVITGDVKTVAKRLCEIIGQGQNVVAGGETTVQVKGKGSGGRNQELCLRIIMNMKNSKKRFVFTSMGTDGIDGETSSAGAIVDEKTISKARKKGLDVKRCLEKNDSGTFFKKMKLQINTGPTGNNLSDIAVCLVDLEE